MTANPSTNGPNGPVTVEAEYQSPNDAEGRVDTWTFEERSPQSAKDVVVSRHVPLDATLHRIGVWHGWPDDRPDGGHESGILEE